MKTWGSGGTAPTFLTLALYRWRWAVSFTPPAVCAREKSSCTHRIGGWEGTGAGLKAVEKRTIPCPRPSCSPSLYRLNYCGLCRVNKCHIMIHLNALVYSPLFSYFCAVKYFWAFGTQGIFRSRGHRPNWLGIREWLLNALWLDLNT
jgi:hypothetical protein